MDHTTSLSDWLCKRSARGKIAILAPRLAPVRLGAPPVGRVGAVRGLKVKLQEGAFRTRPRSSVARPGEALFPGDLAGPGPGPTQLGTPLSAGCPTRGVAGAPGLAASLLHHQADRHDLLDPSRVWSLGQTPGDSVCPGLNSLAGPCTRSRSLSLAWLNESVLRDAGRGWALRQAGGRGGEMS